MQWGGFRTESGVALLLGPGYGHAWLVSLVLIPFCAQENNQGYNICILLANLETFVYKSQRMTKRRNPTKDFFSWDG
jgi:hypothetical protein